MNGCTGMPPQDVGRFHVGHPEGEPSPSRVVPGERTALPSTPEVHDAASAAKGDHETDEGDAEAPARSSLQRARMYPVRSERGDHRPDRRRDRGRIEAQAVAHFW